MSAKKKSISLADKISSLVTSVPTTFGSDDEDEETKAKVVDFDDELDDNNDEELKFNSSNIRKKNVSLLEDIDKRYTAKKVSRKEIFNDGDSSEDNNDDNSEDGDEESEEGESDADSGNEDEEDENGSDGEGDNDNDDDEDGESLPEGSDEEESDYGDDFDESVDRSNPLRRERDPGIKTMSATNIRAEIEKGNCVREQLKMWENLLEMRIKLQKCLTAGNKMPQHDIFKNYQEDSEFKKNCKGAQQKLGGLLNNLLQLQSKLLNKFPETKDLLNKSKKRKADDQENNSNLEDDLMDEEIPSDTEDEMNVDEENGEDQEESGESENEESKNPPKKKIKLSEFENLISKNHKAYADYRNSVIQKWNDKTRISTGVVGKGANQPALKQIEFAMVNRDKLLQKTQLKRSEYSIIGKELVVLEDNDGRRTQEYDTEIYDDDDFYHQLLRELIEFKSADVTDPIQLSKQWIQLQNMRSKMKRKIDTRATKGRRLRYDVHQKLVNFMAPITVFESWTDHAKDELYSSLFGKSKRVNNESKST